MAWNFALTGRALLLHRGEEAAWRTSVCRFPPVTIRRLILQPLDSFCPSRGRVGTPLIEPSPSATFPLANTEVSAGKKTKQGWEEKPFGPNYALDNTVAWKEKKGVKKKYSIIVMSDFHYMYVQV